jgi:hypothetical protein
MGLMARPVAPIANVVMAVRPVRVLVEKTIKVHRGAAMPRSSSPRSAPPSSGSSSATAPG